MITFQNTTQVRDTSRLSRSAAASALGISPANVGKLIDAGMLDPNLPREQIRTLAGRRYLQAETGEMTVLRHAPKAPAYDDRDWIGSHISMTDDEMETTQLRWWRSDPARVIAAGLFAVTVSTLPVAVWAIDDLVETRPYDGEAGERAHFRGRLLGRVEPDGTWGTREADVPAWMLDATAAISTARIEVSSGGPIGYLTADA